MKIFTLLFIIWLHNVKSAKILGIFNIPSRSHYILGSALLRGLAAKGHDVTMVSPFGEKKLPPNYKDVILTGLFEEIQAKMNEQSFFEVEDINPIFNIFFVNGFGETFAEKALQHENFQKLIKSNEKFDIIIVEQFVNDAFKALAKYYGAHLIMFSTIGANLWINPLVGNPSPPSYIPCLLSKYSSDMSIFERFMNTLIIFSNEVINYVKVWPNQNRLIKTYISKDINLDDVLYNMSIVLLNSHPSTNQPVPIVPNMIDIGGFHVRAPNKLPKDLQQFLDKASDGVIYFSLGSNLKSAQLPVEKRNAIIAVFSKLKEKILWKWEEETMEGKPDNVKFGKWLPQQDILAHPNVKLFITHGGLLSTTETVYHGVPVLAIPIFGDQKMNARNIVNGGFGLSLPYKELNEITFKENIEELLNNPKYRNNAKIRSKIFHDRPIKPMDAATFWVDYVLRHNGASHLRIAAINLPWYKYFLVDIAVIIVLVLIIVLIVIKLLFKKNKQKLKRN